MIILKMEELVMNNNEKRKFICIRCPIGCEINVKKIDNEYIVKFNKCSRGEKYVLEEITNPTRVLTTTVKLKNSPLVRLPVKTNKAISKELIFKCMKILNSLEIEAPVEMNDILIKDILGSGINIISTKSVKEIC